MVSSYTGRSFLFAVSIFVGNKNKYKTFRRQIKIVCFWTHYHNFPNYLNRMASDRFVYIVLLASMGIVIIFSIGNWAWNGYIFVPSPIIVISSSTSQVFLYSMGCQHKNGCIKTNFESEEKLMSIFVSFVRRRRWRQFPFNLPILCLSSCTVCWLHLIARNKWI